MKITHINGPKRSREVHTWFVASDLHGLSCDLPSLEIMLSCAQAVHEPMLVLNGDIIDVDYLMPRSSYFKYQMKRGVAEAIESAFIPSLEQEVKFYNELLDRCEKIFKEIIVIEGNHEVRIENFRDAYSPCAYRHIFDLPKLLRLKEREIKFVKYNNWLDIGANLSITHGMAHGQSALKKHHEKVADRNVIFGHIHKAGMQSFQSRGKTVLSYSLPSMCDETNSAFKYMKNADTDWSTGFAIANLMHGNVWVNIFITKDGRLVSPNGFVMNGTNHL